MKVNVKNFLSRIFACIENDTEALFLDSNVLGDLARPEQDVTQEVLFFFGNVIQGGEVFFGHDQNVGWCLGVDVIECNDPVILKDEFGWDLFADNFAEQAIFHFCSSIP
jgi:hypothetical protein